ncbi:MAG: hypothetical protein IKH22_09860 [Prevotella sp.]|nr:hypothetical protein [Prevotella sp.]
MPTAISFLLFSALALPLRSPFIVLPAPPFWRICQVIPAELPNKTDGIAKQNRQNCQTKPMELLNEINGIVQQYQWNRSAISMDLFLEIGNLAARNRQNHSSKAPKHLRKSSIFPA